MKKLVSLLLAVVLVMGLLPMAALAEDSVTVGFSAQAMGAFLAAPADCVGLTVQKNLAESYGYEDDVSGVSALDVLVKAHEVVFGADDFAQNHDSYLVLSSGFLTTIFGTETSNCGFAVNGRAAVDTATVYPAGYGMPESYLGLGITQAEIHDGDFVEFFLYQDAYAMDYYTWFADKTGSRVNEVQTEVGADLELCAKGYAFGWYSAAVDESYRDGEAIVDSGDCEELPVVLIDAATGAATAFDPEVALDEDGCCTVSFPAAGEYLLAVQGDAYTDVVMPLLRVTVYAPTNAAITAPKDATLWLGEKNFTGYNFKRFDTVAPVYTQESGDTVTYRFALTNNKWYQYRVSDETHATTAGVFQFKSAKGYSDTVALSGSKDALVRDVTANNGYNNGDIYLNINPQGWLNLAQGETYQLVHLRRWEIVDSVTANNFVEPDYHYAVLDAAGAPSSGVVTVSEGGLLTAVGSGTAIVLVTYDALNAPGAVGGPLFGAILPENTGVFVVTVDGAGGFDTGMTINEGKNDAMSKLAGDAIDAELDVIYFTGETGAYTFTPAVSHYQVAVANPTVADKLTYTGFTAVAPNGDGTVTVPLTEGRNVVKMTQGGKTAYQVITAKRVNVTVNGGDAVHPGDELTVAFDTLYHPASKIAGVYNMSAAALYFDVNGQTDAVAGGVSAQYNFASNSAAQKVANYSVQKSQWGAITFTAGDPLTVPADYTGDVFTLSGGVIAATGFGDHFGNHRYITLTDGKAPNLNADAREAYFGLLPDVTIPIVLTDAALSEIAITAQPTKTAYETGDAFDASGMVVTATYEDSKTQTVSGYSVSPETLTAGTTEITVSYGGKTATVPVTVTEPVLASVAITALPTKTAYTAGETFDPSGMVVTAAYESGKTVSVSDYTYTGGVLTADMTEVTVTYGDKTASVPITVSEAGGGAAQTITVTFSLLGDAKHGAGETVHTYKNGKLATWIAPMEVTVPTGATVAAAVTKALGMQGIAFTNTSGNYISEINGLGEFDNGENSGWMYLLNGTRAMLGIAEQTLTNGDRIVLHYTDDWTLDTGNEQFAPSGGGAGAAAEEKQPEETQPAVGAYTDVAAGAWYESAVAYVTEHGLMNGTGDGKFSPEGTMTRAMLMAVLARCDGQEIGGADWAAQAVNWAQTSGVSDGKNPNETVTREQLCTMLYRFAGSPEAGGELTFADADDVSEWAQAAMRWAVKNGIVNGMTETTLAPQGTATRAQAAAILMRFMKLIT